MKKHLALFATLLTIVALPNKLLAGPDEGGHPVEAHIEDGATDTHAVSDRNYTQGDVRSTTPVIQNNAATRNSEADKEDASVNMNKKSEGLFLSANQDISPFDAAGKSIASAFTSIKTAIPNLFVVDPEVKMNYLSLTKPFSSRAVFQTKNPASKASQQALAAGNVVGFANQNGVSYSAYLTKAANNIALNITGYAITSLAATVTYTKKLAANGLYFYAAPFVNGRSIVVENSSTLQLTPYAAAQAVANGKTIIVDNGTKSAILAKSSRDGLTITIAFDGTKQATGFPPIFIAVLTAVVAQ